MSLVWRKIQRSNKKATKLEFTAELQELSLQCSSDKWHPSKLCVAWVHRRRRYVSKEYRWEPTITDPSKGLIVWGPSAECIKMVTTLYRDQRGEGYEDKEWTFVVEEVNLKGKRRPLAAVNLNLRLFIHEIPGAQTQVKLKLRPLTHNVSNCVMQLLLTSTILKEGHALDDDLRSEASAMSMQREGRSVSPLEDTKSSNQDIANLKDLEEFSPSGSTSQDIASVVADIEKLKESMEPPNATSTPHGTTTKSFNLMPSKWEQIEKKSPLEDSADLFSKCSPIKPTTIESNISQDSGFGRVFGSDHTDSIVPCMSLKDERSELDSLPCESSTPAPKLEKLNSSQDLLTWVQQVLKPYNIKVTNFSASFRNGLALCALIHHHNPELIPGMYTLNGDNIGDNVNVALDAAAKLGVPKLIDPNDMVIMAVPDKIAVISYVHSLRAALTGVKGGVEGGRGAPPKADPNQSILSLSELDAKVLEEFDRLKKEREEDDVMDLSYHQDELGPVDKEEKKKRRKKGKSPKKEKKRTDVKNTSADFKNTSAQSSSVTAPSPLMTRKQLVDPFASDEENENGVVEGTRDVTHSPPTTIDLCDGHAKSRSRSSSNSIIDIPEKNMNGVSREDDLKRRAKIVLDQFTREVDGNGREPTPQLEDTRQRELRERARKLIQDTRQEVMGTVHIQADDSMNGPSTSQTHEQKSTCLPRGGGFEESFNVKPLRRTGSFTRRTEFYQPRLNKDNESVVSAIESPSIPALRGLKVQSYPNSPAHNSNNFENITSPSESTLDRFKRFGSMRKQELTQSINVLSNRIADTVRATSVPKELGDLHTALPDNPVPQSCSVVETNSHHAEGSKLSSDWEKDLHSHRTLVTQLEQLNCKQKALDKQATDTEKKWRRVMDKAPGSDEEQRLMNEFLRLLNERNLLYRHELHLSLMQKIQHQENCFQLVQQRLAKLIQVEDDDKTEDDKGQIDSLMGELVTIVNNRDGLVQQLMQNEQREVDDTELGAGAIMMGKLDSYHDKNCSIM